MYGLGFLSPEPQWGFWSAYFSPCRTTIPARFYSCPTVRGCSLLACLEPFLNGAAWRSEGTKRREGYLQVYCQNQPTALLLLPYLASFYRCGDEGGLRQELRSTQQVSDSIHISLVLFHWLHLHLLFWQQGFTTRSVTRWGKELKVTMSPAQQKTHPNDEKKVVLCCISKKQERYNLYALNQRG